MFRYKTKSKTVDGEYTILTVEFYSETEKYYETYKVWNNNYEMELQSIINNQINLVLNLLNSLYDEFGSIYDQEGKLKV